jgi:hypothetical protein
MCFLLRAILHPRLRNGKGSTGGLFPVDSTLIKILDGEAHFIVPPNEIPMSQQKTLESLLIQEPPGLGIQ